MRNLPSVDVASERLSGWSDDETLTRSEWYAARVAEVRRVVPLTATLGPRSAGPIITASHGPDRDGIIHGTQFWRCDPKCDRCRDAANAARQAHRAAMRETV